MKKMITTIAMVGLLSMSGYAAAMPMSAQSAMTDPMGMMAIGTISVSNQSTLDDIEQALQARAEKKGASHYQITSVSGHNMLHSTAIIYR